MGTHTSNNEPNFLMLVKVKIPIKNNTNDEFNQIDEVNEINENEKDKEINININTVKIQQETKFEITQKINHEGEVNRARHMPQKPNIIATKTNIGEVHIFDYNKHPSCPTDSAVRPELRLTGHTEEGCGLSWSTLQNGYLLSGSYDNRVII